MSRFSARGEEVRRFILENVQANPGNICRLTLERFGVSRQAISSHLRRLVRVGALRETGWTRSRIYRLAPLLEWSKAYLLADRPEEDVIWWNDIRPLLNDLPENIYDIWAYGFTEMFNNAKDHSGGRSISIAITKTAAAVEMRIVDDGIGIFRKIQSAMNLLDERHAMFELAKGKLTTDPAHHSGEGIFFTSRAFDGFDILSEGFSFPHPAGRKGEWLLELPQPAAGTAVFMKLHNDLSRTLMKIFDQYAAGIDSPAFSKTVVPVQLAQYGNEKLISRPQAKRVLARVELFKIAVLDFMDVPAIGQAFADEVFRVFPLEHPGIELIPVNANDDVARMIQRV